jgi:hypothetical protein
MASIFKAVKMMEVKRKDYRFASHFFALPSDLFGAGSARLGFRISVFFRISPSGFGICVERT